MIRNRRKLTRTDRHEHVLQSLEDGIEAAHPRTVIERTVRLEGTQLHVGDDSYDLDSYDNIIVVGGGNAAGHVASALETVLGRRITSGVVVTDSPVDTDTITVIEGTHPLPSDANREGTEQLRSLAAQTGENDLVLVVITGGGSALLCAPREELSIQEYRTVTDQLLRSGATIDEINTLRKHLSTIKGGKLARSLSPSRTVGLVISDVVGNRLDVIASGPTTPDPSTFAECIEIRDRYDLSLSNSVRRILEAGVETTATETPDTNDDVFDRVTNHILADNRTALEVAGATLEGHGYPAQILSSRIEGEASEVGLVHAGIATECLASGDPFKPPVALLSGGETTVTVTDDGKGGPNQEFALQAALEIDHPHLLVASIDTDGIDGNTNVAGAIVDSETVPSDETTRARSDLEHNNAYEFLFDRDVLIETGPTGTNVNDLRVVLVDDEL